MKEGGGLRHGAGTRRRLEAAAPGLLLPPARLRHLRRAEGRAAASLGPAEASPRPGSRAQSSAGPARLRAREAGRDLGAGDLRRAVPAPSGVAGRRGRASTARSARLVPDAGPAAGRRPEPHTRHDGRAPGEPAAPVWFGKTPERFRVQNVDPDA
jgi:hypothetical protein